MRSNMSARDRRVRVVLAAGLAIVSVVLLLAGSADGLALLVVAAVAATTAATGRCPLYALNGFSTRSRDDGGSGGCCSGLDGSCNR